MGQNATRDRLFFSFFVPSTCQHLSLHRLMEALQSRHCSICSGVSFLLSRNHPSTKINVVFGTHGYDLFHSRYSEAVGDFKSALAVCPEMSSAYVSLATIAMDVYGNYRR